MLSYPASNDINFSYEKGSKTGGNLYKHSLTKKKLTPYSQFVKLDSSESERGHFNNISQERNIYKGYGKLASSILMYIERKYKNMSKQ
jgi:hypothetical protein